MVTLEASEWTEQATGTIKWDREKHPGGDQHEAQIRLTTRRDTNLRTTTCWDIGTQGMQCGTTNQEQNTWNYEKGADRISNGKADNSEKTTVSTTTIKATNIWTLTVAAGVRMDNSSSKLNG